MRPFLPKDTYRHAVHYTNLAGPLTRLNPTYAPRQWCAAAMASDTFTRTGCFKQAVGVHALQGSLLLQIPVSLGLDVAALKVGGFRAWLALALLQNVGTGSDLSEEGQRAASERHPMKPMKMLNDYANLGIMGVPERIVRDRAQAAFDAGRGFAHAAWTGVALGLNGLLWLPRVGAALLNHGMSMVGALIGASVGVVRFCWDAWSQGHVRAPHHYFFGISPRRDSIGEALNALDTVAIDSGWLANVFERPSPEQLDLAADYLALMRDYGGNTSLDNEIERLAQHVASERSFDPKARAMLRKLTKAFFGDTCMPETLRTTYRRRALAVHPDKGPERATREELMRALTALKTSIERFPTLKETFFPTPA